MTRRKIPGKVLVQIDISVILINPVMPYRPISAAGCNYFLCCMLLPKIEEIALKIA